MRYLFHVVAFLLLAVAACKAADPRRERVKPYVPAEQFEAREIEGWQIKLNRKLLGPSKEVGNEVLALLQEKLREIRERVPPNAVEALQQVTIWVGVDDSAIHYHSYLPGRPSPGLDPNKAKGVYIGDAAGFIKRSRDQLLTLLHELAHSYHDQVLGFGNEKIIAAFKRAKRSGKYEAVKKSDKSTGRAYALTNELEYFAECSVAYFAQNETQPFNREELKTFDPEMYRVLEEVWNR